MIKVHGIDSIILVRTPMFLACLKFGNSFSVFSHTKFSKAKLPLKIKMFQWLVAENGVLTKDYLTKRGIQAELICILCGIQEERGNHLFFKCNFSSCIFWDLLIIFNVQNGVLLLDSFRDSERRILSEKTNRDVQDTIAAVLCYCVFGANIIVDILRDRA